jgi:hypothetical protein
MKRLGFLTMLLAVQLRAQTVTAPQKDAGVATLLSVVIPGAGQLYAEETGRGLAFMFGTVAFVTLGYEIGKSPIAPIYMGPYTIPGDPGHVNAGPVIAGAAVGAALWIWSALDAGPAARRTNAKNARVSVVPMHGGAGVRLTL